jgi:hypothetical protein
MLAQVAADAGLSIDELLDKPREWWEAEAARLTGQAATAGRASAALRALAPLFGVFPGATVGEAMVAAGINLWDYPADPEAFSDLDVQRLRRDVAAALARRS